MHSALATERLYSGWFCCLWQDEEHNELTTPEHHYAHSVAKPEHMNGVQWSTVTVLFITVSEGFLVFVGAFALPM
jgi:hypothetical protein